MSGKHLIGSIFLRSSDIGLQKTSKSQLVIHSAIWRGLTLERICLQNFGLELAICGENGSDNPTLCQSLHRFLKQRFVDTVKKLAVPGNEKKLMLFKGDESFMLNLVAKSMPKVLKAGLRGKKNRCYPIALMAHRRLQNYWKNGTGVWNCITHRGKYARYPSSPDF